MKTTKGIALSLMAISLWACSDENLVSDATIKGITVKSEAFQLDEPQTKASYTVDPSQGFILNWTDGDVIGIYPVGGDQVAFPISSGSGTTAQFDGGSWAVRSNYNYAAYYPFNTDYYTIAQTALPVSYTGQAQTGNGSTANLGRYDYQASAATAPDGTGNISITVKHLGCFVRLQLTVPVVDTFTSLTLTSDNESFVTAGTFDLTNATPSITNTATSSSMTMALNGVSNTAGNKVVTLYLMAAPADLSSSTITATLTGTVNQSYTATFDGKNMLKGKAYAYSATVSSGTNINGENIGWDDNGTQLPSFWVSDGNGHYYVDLGLSIKWATINVGATVPCEYGDYFAWGETTPYYETGYAQEDPQSHWKTGKSEGYNWISYKYCKGSDNTQTKYCNNSSYGYNGFTDNKTVLDAGDDAASVNWGGSWRMPTIDELNELKNTDNCTWAWYESGNSEFNGVAGCKVTSNKIGYTDKFIFLPAAGFRSGTVLLCVGSYGVYWSRSLFASDPSFAYNLSFYSGGFSTYDRNYRVHGFSVRPVCH